MSTWAATGGRTTIASGQDGAMTSPGNGSERPQQVVVVGPDGRPVGAMPVGAMPMGQASDDDGDGDPAVSEMVEQPAKVMRIGTMIKQLLEEVRAAPLDDASRNRLRDIHATSIRELEQGLAPELREELERITLPFNEDETPSDAELRIAQAQLVGWLEGVFHGIQTALFAQQMAARAQLEDMRRKALPGGQAPGHPEHRPGGGQYL
jgi:hypothetical protein